LERYVSLRNTGNALLSVTSITRSGSPLFSVDSPIGAFMVAAGGQQTVVLSFGPTGTALQTGTLTIMSNDPDEPVRSVSLQGKGRLGEPSPL
jgi:hypothetical protein